MGDKRDEHGDVVDDAIDEGPTPAMPAATDDDAARVNNLVLGAGQPAEVRYPHQVPAPADPDAANPQEETVDDAAKSDETRQADEDAEHLRKSQKRDATTRATETPGEKR